MFVPSEVQTFRFRNCEYDEASGRALFSYSFDDSHHFTEEFVFPVPSEPLAPQVRAAVDRAVFLLSLVAGVSYYKAALPPVAIIESGPLRTGDVDFLRDVFIHGLGEFAFVNGLSLGDGPDFRFEDAGAADAVDLGLARRSLVAVGGGKDSCVSIETLQASNELVLLASVNKPRAIAEVMSTAGLPSVSVARKLSSELLALNDAGAYNGHVPITAIVSLALTATALITDCDSIVMSNERSASAGNLDHEGRTVNHQYSKGIEFERAVASLIHTSIAQDLSYFSLLRPLSELEIARRFASYERYDQVFTSCNRAFRIDEDRRIDHWCCECDKCRFVFLALAPFCDPLRLRKIFGDDVLDDPAQAGGFDALLGYNTHKPFECVGEVEESAAAFLLLISNPEWRDHAIVKRFAQEVLPDLVVPDDAMNRPFEMSDDHEVPPRFLEMLRATA